MKRVAVLDPGRCKCGLVLVDLQLGLVREGHVLAPEAVEPLLEHWNQDQALDRILIGDGTGSRAWIQRLERLGQLTVCLLYTSPSPRDGLLSRMPSSA